MWHKVSKTDPRVSAAIKACLPGWKGRTVYVMSKPLRLPLRYYSWWEGGVKHTYHVLAPNGTAWTMPTNHPVFEADRPQEIEAPDGTVIIEHVRGRGHGYVIVHLPSGLSCQIDEAAHYRAV